MFNFYLFIYENSFILLYIKNFVNGRCYLEWWDIIKCIFGFVNNEFNKKI